MNAEKDQLSKTLLSLNAIKEETSRSFWDREVLTQKKIDIIEKLVQEFNSMIDKVRSSLSKKDAHFDFNLDLNPHATKNDGLLTNCNLKEFTVHFFLNM